MKKIEKLMKQKNYSEKHIYNVLNYSKGLEKRELPLIFDRRHLAKLMGIELRILNYYIYNSNKFYTSFKIMKKNGGYRFIDAPSMNLKKIQAWLQENLLGHFKISSHCYGFVNNKGILNNAMNHTKKKLVYNIDLEEFFPSISSEKIYFLFYNYGYTSELSYVFTQLLTYNGALPQGAPSSPMLSNIISFEMDNSISQYAKENNLSYSRYVDDITLSFNSTNNYMNMVKTVKKIIEYHDFKLNINKENFHFENQPQFVTGLLVNEEVKIRRKFKKEVEQQLYFCEKHGVMGHLNFTGNSHRSFFKEYLYGKVNFIKSIEKEYGEELLSRLNNLDWSY